MLGAALASGAYAKFGGRKAVTDVVNRAAKGGSSVLPGTRTNKHYSKKAYPKYKIGPHGGSIIAGKKIANTGVRSVVREKTFGTTQANSRVWFGGASTGNETRYIHAIAEALLIKVLTKIGDIRSDKQLAPATIGTNGFFDWIRLIYAQEGSSYGATGDGAQQGVQIPNGDLKTMADSLASELLSKAQTGYYPVQLVIFRNDDGGAANCIYMDQAVGKMRINMKVSGLFRIQNVTLAADGTDGTGGTVVRSSDKNAVDANPLNGRIYKFRNRVPLFRQPYLTNQPDPQHDLLEGLMDTENIPLETGINYTVLNNPTVGNVSALEAPPLRPTTIFANATTMDKVFFEPGQHKTFKTSYGYEGSLFAILRDFIRVGTITAAGAAPPATVGKVPPAGDSFLMCMQPTLKTASGELVKLAWDATFIYDCKASFAKIPRLATTNFI